ncbi:hypothetical protein EG829_30015 [bacterium]|nr:hypothetical protein [bacterium]
MSDESTITGDHLAAWHRYQVERLRLLGHLDIAKSNREPMAEFAEVLVRDLLDGSFPPTRTQKGWDVRTPGGERVQVRYLANRTGNWCNWHWVASSDQWDWYALVLFVDLQPVAVHVFPSGDLSAICGALKKKHGNRDRLLSYTYGNFMAIQNDPDTFTALGMRVFDLRANDEQSRSTAPDDCLTASSG